MSQSFATVQDLEARWRILEPAERDRAKVLLEDAAVKISAAFRGLDTELSGELKEKLSGELRIVSCNMVKRAMFTDAGVQSTQETVGPFSATHNFTNPTGDLYLAKADRKLLGLERQQIVSIMPMFGDSHVCY